MRSNASINMNALDASVNQNGSVIGAQQTFAASAVAVVTGTAAGTLVMQGSNDTVYAVDAKGVAVPVSWFNIPSATVAVSGAGTYLIPKTDICYQWIRTSYVKTSGTGAITVTVNKSGV